MRSLHRLADTRYNVGLAHVLAGAIVMIADAFFVEVDCFGTKFEHLMQGRQRRDSVVTHKRAGAAVEWFRRIVANHLDADGNVIIARGMDAIRRKVTGNPYEVRRDEQMGPTVPAHSCVIVVEISDA